ncbi:hypothetical protein S2E19_00918 [Bacillus mycoides]|nr:hypothetical protein [Bacillus mycoides]MED1041787.1 hypothetical protein [Bacillus mycoides]OSY05943.1 hypothetical protein S2E19_00918 [Bacillus mycoides]
MLLNPFLLFISSYDGFGLLTNITFPLIPLNGPIVEEGVPPHRYQAKIL